MTRIILFGATGYTGRLTADRLAAARSSRDTASAATPGFDQLVLAGRSQAKLDQLADELSSAFPGGPPTAIAVADVADPATVAALVQDPTDVIISTVGPFFRWGRPAVDAAIAAGATYVDSTGEPAFLRMIFDHDGPRAKHAGASLLPAFGYDYVPGNLAGALAIADARANGSPAVRLDIGYFMGGQTSLNGTGAATAASSGTAATGAGIILEPSYGFHHGKINTESAGREVASFTIDGRRLAGLSLGATEHYGMPNIAPQLQEVRVFLGAAGQWTKALGFGSRGLAVALKVPGVKAGLANLAARTVTGSKGGPDAEARARIRSQAIAIAFDNHDEIVATVLVDGPSPYDLTADLLAWAARNAGAIGTVGTLAPTDAFGVDGLVQGCAEIGLARVPR